MEKLANEETRTSGGNENKNDPLVIDIITMLEMSEPPVSTGVVYTRFHITFANWMKKPTLLRLFQLVLFTTKKKISNHGKA